MRLCQHSQKLYFGRATSIAQDYSDSQVLDDSTNIVLGLLIGQLVLDNFGDSAKSKVVADTVGNSARVVLDYVCGLAKIVPIPSFTDYEAIQY